MINIEALQNIGYGAKKIGKGNFGDEVSNFVQTVEARLDVIMKKTCAELSRRFILATPVDTGAARASWRMQSNSIDKSVISVKTKISKGAATRLAMAKAKQSAMKINGGDVVFISNNKPYMKKLEYGLYAGTGPKTTSKGYSTQAPKGIVRTNIQDFQVTVSGNVREAKRQVPTGGGGGANFGMRKFFDWGVFR